MVFFTETWKPSSFYDRIRENKGIGLHTLVLLDIKVKEPTLESLARGKPKYEPPRFMTAAQCASQMLEIEMGRKESVYNDQSLAVAVARLGSWDQQIAAGTLQELTTIDMGRPLHSLILLGHRVHDLEKDFIRDFAIDEASFDQAWGLLLMEAQNHLRPE